MSLQDLVKYRDSGELSDVAVTVEGEELKLHKFPLYIKSEYFKDASREAGKDRVDLDDFPGGAACFKLIADFCYNKRIDIGLDNVAQLRCGAEYLKMVGDHNLIDLTERYLDEVLRSAQMSRSLGPIVDLIGRTAALGPAAEEAKLAERCFAAVLEVWTRPGRVDPLVVDRLLRLPLAWFERLSKSCAGVDERQLRPLADLACRYLHRVFQREAQREAQEGKKEEAANKEAEKDKDEAASAPAADSAAAADATPEDEIAAQAGAPEAPEAEAAAKPESQQQQQQQQQQQKQQQQQQQQQEPAEPVGEVLDRVIGGLPEPTPLGEVITGDWIRQALQVSEKHNCQCRPRLLQLAGNMLHRFRQEELKQMPSPVLCDIVSTTVGGEGTDPEVLSSVIDNHLLDLARSGNLSPDDFAKLAASVPADYRASHNTLYEVAETLLTSGESIPDDKQKSVIDAVDLSRCDVATLQRALDKGAFPAKVVCQAAIDLAQKNHQQQQQPQQQQQQQQQQQYHPVSESRSSKRVDDFKATINSSPSRRYRSSPAYDGAASLGHSSYREPLYSAKYDFDYDGSPSRYTGYEATFSDGDRGTRVDFQTSARYPRKY